VEKVYSYAHCTVQISVAVPGKQPGLLARNLDPDMLKSEKRDLRAAGGSEVVLGRSAKRSNAGLAAKRCYTWLCAAQKSAYLRFDSDSSRLLHT
jgi:hypothetical protein